MRIYWWCWLACWVPLGSVGAVAGSVLAAADGLAGVVAILAVVAGVLGGVVAVALDQRRQAPGTTTTTWLSWRPVVRAAGLAAIAVVLLQVWSSVLGPTLWPVLALAALTSPGLVRLVLPHVRGGRRTPLSTASAVVPWCGCGCSKPVTAAEMAGILSVLDDAGLCRAWRASFLRLRGAPGASARLQVAMVRQAYLEELERRDVDGLRRWLETGPRPASGPEDYWRPGPARSSEDQPDAA